LLVEWFLHWGYQKADMKSLSSSNLILPAVLSLSLFISCNNAPKGDNATITDKQAVVGESTGQVYIIDTAHSKIRFIGYGVGKNHPGNFRLASGEVKLDGNQITGGDFVIDIKSLDVEQKEDMFQKKLKPHLLSGDFFDAEKFNTAEFEITGIEPYKPGEKDTSVVDGANFNISGNLTLKGTTKNITFPARIDLDDNVLKGKANFDIDRTQWKMNYGNDKTLGDKFISEKVNIKMDLEAYRQ
jgi:polyisoprenoid-binding protein YceI